MTEREFRYHYVGPGGASLTDTLFAATRLDALRRLRRQNRTVLDLTEIESGGSPETRTVRSKVTSDEAVLVLKQLAVMIRAGVELLEALDIIAGAMAGRPVANALRSTMAGLRQGERLAAAFYESAPFYPPYVYALIRAGEASGRLPLVLEEAGRQMAFEQRVGRDIQNALVYPGFLVVSGLASVSFLFYVVVPRFADMLHNARADISGFSAFVIRTGVAFHDNVVVVLICLAAAVFAATAFAATRLGRATLQAVAYSVPGLNSLLIARQRAAWSRIMSLATAAGVGVLETTALAASALPEGRLKHDVQAALPMLRSGRPVDEAFLKTRALSVVDASLIRAGQRSGALGEMFRAVADRNDEQMRDALKRLTLIVEPVAIAVVAILIGAIVLGLVSALASIYDSIG